MKHSRRNFLEASAFSLSSLLLANSFPSIEAFGQSSGHVSKSESDTLGIPKARIVLGMNQNWRFFRPDDSSGVHSVSNSLPPSNAKWEPATLPHTVRLEPRDVSGDRNYQGVCWYQRTFSVRPEWRDRIVYLKFQGAMQVADVWLNDVHLTTHYGGYLPFTVDLTSRLHFGSENSLTVRLDNSDNPEVPPGKPQSELDFCYFGGLYRTVSLEVFHPLHITDPILADKIAGGGIFVSFPEVSPNQATIHVQTDVANESSAPAVCTVKQELIAEDGTIIAHDTHTVQIGEHSAQAARQTVQIQKPKLWHPDHPDLYWLHTTISEGGAVTDDQYTRIGIRSVQFEKERGLVINGEPFFSIGANRHQDHPYVGYALPASAHYRDAYKLREAGFTSYRSHYPQDPSFMDACDELGILAIVSNPGWQFVGDDVFIRRVYQDAREMIRRDRNRPSVILWEAALNESDNRSVAAELYKIVHEEFPGAHTYSAGDPVGKPVDGFPGWDVGYVGYEKKNPDGPSWIREWGDQVDNWSDQQGRVRVERSWGETPMLIQALAHLGSLNRIYLPETKPAGANLWAGVDAFRGYHHQPFLGAPLDLFRLPKFDYYMFQSQRSPKLRPGHPGYGPMVFIANYGSFHSPLTVTAFSNCEQVRLTQNGKLIATQRPDRGYVVPHPPFTFNVGDFSGTRSMLYGNTSAPGALSTPIGELVAEGLIGGTVVAAHTIHSPGVPKKIELKVDTCGVEPIGDGADWVRVYAHICDARGMTYPYADDFVQFSVQGEGYLIGDERIFANPVRAEAGIATALVGTTRRAGSILVRATAPGLSAGMARFDSISAIEPEVG